ncbi:hypothetical protein C9E81_16785 [Paracoccus alkanivorans]|uniref:Urocanase N-terminal domain-containing protein n=1 Tax=Paracoccus alkanivorans TaxID=2116655 RepID=A0A3M0M726_9RHOB|nr:hypothetical protein C9E81_16785 [Paracoccus alkanivorans]
MDSPRHNCRDIHAVTGTKIIEKSWLTEAPVRMLMNNLHPEMAENPHELVVYGGIGPAARTWRDFDLICCDGSKDADARIVRVLWNDPAARVMRHADAGYEIALHCAKEHQLNLPGIL